MQQVFGASLGGLQWIVDIYILTLATLLLIGGALGDRYGRVKFYNSGMFIFVVASILCGTAPNLKILLAARALQGVGGALLVPAGLAIINAAVAPERRGRLIGTWTMFSSLVVAVGPSLGGWLVDHVSWRSIFYLNVPLGLLAIFVGLRYVPESRNEKISQELDWPGVLTLMIGLGGILFGLIEGPNLGWTSPLTLGALGGGVLGLIIFAIIELRSHAPIVPLRLFRNRNFSGINLVTLLHWMSLTGVFFFLALNLQQVQGYTAFQAGLAIAPVSVLIILLSQPAGAWSDKIGPVPLMIAGLSITGASFFMFMRLGIEESYWTSFFPALCVFGLGLSITIVPVTTIAMGALPNHYSGTASGVNNAASRIANMLAIAIFGLIIITSFRANLAERVADLDLPPTTKADLMDRSRDLAVTQPPEGLSPDLTAATTEAIQLAFLDSFNAVMYASAVITGLCLLVIVSIVRYKKVKPIKRQIHMMEHG
jgi:EmrB/QacA subfamily drug resistance transporter